MKPEMISGDVVPPVDTTLRRITIVYRVLSFFWLLGLAISTLVSDASAVRWVIWSTVAVALTLTAATILLGRRRELLTASPYLIIDVCGSIYIGLAPGFAHSVHLFIGGFLLSSLILVAYARPSWLIGGLVAVLLAVTQLMVPFLSDARDFSVSDALGNVLAIFVTGLVFGWGMEALRQSEALRMEVEAELQNERLLRERATDRAEIADHLHDSVLQTLALIEQKSSDRQQVRTLARRQERELRGYIDQMASPHEASFKAALREVASAVEDLYEVTVNVIVAGDCDLDDGSRAVAAAAKEAIANAARHSGTEEVSVFAEAVDGTLTVFVRDRGIGFEVEGPLSGHRGIRDSIVRRMERHGGSATVRSEAGVGTEVELRIGRS